MNTVNLIGNLTREWDIESTRNGKLVAKNSIAVRKSKDATVFIPIQAWMGTATLLAEHTDKGDKIGIMGYLDVNEYEKDGRKNYFTYVVVQEVTFCGSRKEQKNVNH